MADPRAFWDRMARCKTVEALNREFDRDWRARNGAPEATVEALMYSLHDRGAPALSERDTRRRLGQLSDAQANACGGRIESRRDIYPGVTADQFRAARSNQAAH